jgi:hypothetical protein
MRKKLLGSKIKISFHNDAKKAKTYVFRRETKNEKQNYAIFFFGSKKCFFSF